MKERSIKSGSVVKSLPANAGDLGSVPGWGRSPRERNGNPLQYSGLENPHGQRRQEGLQSMGSQSVDTTEQLNNRKMR